MTHGGCRYEDMSAEDVKREIRNLQAIINCHKRSASCWNHIQRLRDLRLVLETVHDEYLPEYL